jgi:hypothetical protein
MPQNEERGIEGLVEANKETIHSADFQAVLKALLDAYRPILEEDLKRAEDPEALKKEAEKKPPSCEDELALAERLFEKFFTEKVALLSLPAEAREILGPVENWRWCLVHIRCCIIFGWLVCRGPRTFRAFVYYLYRYWICVRQAIGAPVATPLTPDQRADFQKLVEAFAGAYKPYLTDQLASVEFPTGIPDEVLEGRIDCFEGQDEFAEVFDRLLTPEVAEALLGKDAFAKHVQEPSFWFCRCWCLCAIRFGCCLARARNFLEVLICLLLYWLCLRRCFGPLVCEIIKPNSCVEEHEIPVAGILRGIEIVGTAAGAFCDHYTLEWREGAVGPFSSIGIKYPGGAAQGACGVFNGTLGYLETFPYVDSGPVEIQLCLYSTQSATPQCCPAQFELQRNLVWIRGVEGLEAAEPPGIFDPTAQLTDASNTVRSFGTSVRVFGSADVGGCTGQNIKRFTLSYHPGFVVNPLLPGFVQFWQVDYNTLLQLDAGNNNIFEQGLTSRWREMHFPPATCTPVWNWLQNTRWSTLVPQSFPIEPSEAPCPAPPLWSSTPLPITNCQSGRYTLRLTVEDTGAGIKHDLQQVWFDNKDIHGKITQIAGVPPCATIELSKFALGGGDCTQPWPASLLGIAYDEYIEEGNAANPSDNFGGYRLNIKKDGGPWFHLPIPGPGAPPWAGPLVGTSRVGDPGTRCPNASPPAGVIPPETAGILALIDFRRLDAVCNPAEPQLTLNRAHISPNGEPVAGECCGYILHLQTWDNSICPSLSAGRHQIDDFFPICICNDLRLGPL